MFINVQNRSRNKAAKENKEGDIFYLLKRMCWCLFKVYMIYSGYFSGIFLRAQILLVIRSINKQTLMFCLI